MSVRTNRLQNFSFTPRVFFISLMLFVVLVTIIALTFSTRQVTKGYVLNKLDDEHGELLKMTEHQEIRISEVRSMSFIEGAPELYGMVKPSNVVYFDPNSTIAAK